MDATELNEIQESIIKTIQKLSGDNPAYDYFTVDFIAYINTAINILQGIGVGDASFVLTGVDDKWEDFIPDGKGLGLVKAFIKFKTTLYFDPPNNSFLIQNINDNLKELEYRLYCMYDEP